MFQFQAGHLEGISAGPSLAARLSTELQDTINVVYSDRPVFSHTLLRIQRLEHGTRRKITPEHFLPREARLGLLASGLRRRDFDAPCSPCCFEPAFPPRHFPESKNPFDCKPAIKEFAAPPKN
jgi:hypothetical protein